MKPSVPAPDAPPRIPLRERLRLIPIRTHRMLALAVVVLAGMTLIPWPWSFHGLRYELGRVQPSTVIADFDFPVLKEPGELERERAARARATFPRRSCAVTPPPPLLTPGSMS